MSGGWRSGGLWSLLRLDDLQGVKRGLQKYTFIFAELNRENILFFSSLACRFFSATQCYARNYISLVPFAMSQYAGSATPSSQPHLYFCFGWPGRGRGCFSQSSKTRMNKSSGGTSTVEGTSTATDGFKYAC